MPEPQTIALFPLRVVMFPGSKLELQIFERRYMDLITRCLRNDEGFGICLLREGEEVVREAGKQIIHRTGIHAKIIDWNQLENGLLGITVEGQSKFRIHDCWQAESGILEANVEFIATDNLQQDAIPHHDELAALVDLLQNLERHPMVKQKNIKVNYDNLWELGWRLSELIPIEMEMRQHLLELDDPWDRIEQIEHLLSELVNDDS